MKLRIWFASLWISCLAHAGTLYQVSTLQALMEGRFDGVTTVGEIKQHGAFGLGTFHALEGELILVHGQLYQALGDGTVLTPSDSTRVPFACVANVNTDDPIKVLVTMDTDRFTQTLDNRFSDPHVPIALYMTGAFARVSVRSVHAQAQPYPTLPEVIAQQTTFEREDVQGELVGFRLPDFWEGVNAPGYHFHFISSDRTFGGHVLDLETEEAWLYVQELNRVTVDLPAGPREDKFNTGEVYDE